MNFDFVDNSIYIVPNRLKMKLLETLSNSSKIYNITFISIEEFIYHYKFKIKDNAIIYLLDKVSSNIDIVNTIIKNIYKIDVNKDYSESKLTKLVNIYKDLLKNNYIEFDMGYKEYLKTKNIFVFGYNKLDLYQKKLLEEVSAKYINIQGTYIPKTYYKYHSLKDEVIATALKIRKLNENKVEYKKIFLAGVDSNYVYLMKSIFKMFDIPLILPKNEKVTSLIPIKKYLETKDINFIQDVNLKYKVKLIENELEYAKNSPYYDILLMDKLNTISLEDINLIDSVRVVEEALEIPYLISDDEYLFVLGFNQNILPKIVSDNDYLSDKLKKVCQINTSIESNKLNKKNLCETLKTIKNLTISYKLTSLTSEYAKSSLLDELNLEEVNDTYYNYNYSSEFNTYKLGCCLDLYYKYNEKDKDFSFLINNINSNDYMSYNHKFKGIEKNVEPYTLSYSMIDKLSMCPFRYYLEYILKLDNFEENFNTKIGNIFHAVLKDSYDKNFNFQISLAKALKDNNLDKRELVLFEKLKKELENIVLYNKEMEKRSILDEFYGEKKIEIKLTDKANLKGYIDKILYKNFHNNTYYAIYDYKTGLAKLNLDYLKEGLYMQLPLYVYLVIKSNLFTNPKFLGFYYQHLLQNYKNEQERVNNLKLDGYTTSNLEDISYIDDEYENSSYIKSLLIKKDGTFHSKSKILTDSEINDMLNKIDNALEKTLQTIESNDYKIAPKIINNKNVSCSLCPFKEICFATVDDYIYLEKGKEDMYA